MAAQIVVDVYLNAKSGSTGPGNDSVIFTYGLQKYTPEDPAKPGKAHVTREGDIYIGDTAVDKVLLTFALQTHNLTWNGKAFTASLTPTGNHMAEDMLWISLPGKKPTARWDPNDKRFDGFKHSVGNAKSLEVRIHRDKIGWIKDQFPYSLAVNVIDSGGQVTTVREDPQIRDRGVPGANWYDTYQQLGIGLLVGIVIAYLALRMRRQRAGIH